MSPDFAAIAGGLVGILIGSVIGAALCWFVVPPMTEWFGRRWWERHR